MHSLERRALAAFAPERLERGAARRDEQRRLVAQGRFRCNACGRIRPAGERELDRYTCKRCRALALFWRRRGVRPNATATRRQLEQDRAVQSALVRVVDNIAAQRLDAQRRRGTVAARGDCRVCVVCERRGRRAHMLRVLGRSGRRRWVCSPLCAYALRAATRMRYEPGGAWLTARKLRDRWALYGDRCAYGCGRPATASDHRIARARGGSSLPANLVPCCDEHNTEKGAERVA